MSIPFSDLNPETVTTICNTNETNIDLLYAFLFIPIETPENVEIKRRGSKIAIPSKLNIPGKIISMRYNQMCRGLIRTTNTRCFRHSIIIDIGTKKHPLSIKLTNGKISITGPYSHLLTNDIISAVNENLKIANKRLEYFKMDVFDYQETGVLHLSEHSKYLEKEYTHDEIRQFMDTFILILEEEDNPQVCTEELRLLNSYTAMVNLNFNIGYAVRLTKLTELLKEQGIEAYSNNIRSRKCRVIFQDINTEADNKPVVHTITISKTGGIRYSGPSLKLMEPVYTRLSKIIEENRDIIEIRDVNLISPYRNANRA